MQQQQQQQQPLSWNSFQRLHKGQYTKEELSRQWKLYKQRQRNVTTPTQAHAYSTRSRTATIAALRSGIAALTAGAHRHSTDDSQASDVIAATGNAEKAAEAAPRTSGGAKQYEQQTCAAPTTLTAAAGAVTCTPAPGPVCAPSTPTRQLHPVVDAPAHSSCAAVASPAPVSSISSTPASARARLRELLRWGQPSPSPSPAAVAATDAACAALSPSPDAASAGQQGQPAPHDVVQLRSAVQQLLSVAATPPRHPGAAQHQPLVLGQQQHRQHQQQQQQQQQLVLELSAPLAVTVSPMPAQSHGTGCFGGWAAVPAGGGSKQLCWNHFQKACKGRGMTKTEISAAFAAAKQLQQQQQQQQQQQEHQGSNVGLDLSHYLDQYQQQQRQQEHQQQWLLQHRGYSQPAQGRWGAVRGWVQSRAGSRAASRMASRAASRHASPDSSPATSRPAAAQQEQQQQHQEAEATSKWGSIKQWVRSRGNSRATSRAASPSGEAPGQQQQHNHHHNLQLHNTNQQQQQHQVQGDAARAGAVDVMPFAAQLGLVQEVGGDKPQLPETPHTPVRQLAACSSLEPLHDPADQAGSSSQGDAAAVVAAVTTAAHAAPTCHAAVPTQGAHSSRSWGSRGGIMVAAKGFAGVVWIGHRVARETVPHDLPGLLVGFGPWVPVQPARLKQLKLAVPARPGLYEWGVRFPLAVKTSVHGSNTAGGGSKERVCYGPVLPFYLGKAGTLSRQRCRQTSKQGMVLGETLRTRLNKYCRTRAGRLGPWLEQHKDTMFAQYQQAGGQLCYRWCIAADTEPAEMEQRLLGQLDWAANYMHNNNRRCLLVPPVEQQPSSVAGDGMMAHTAALEPCS